MCQVRSSGWPLANAGENKSAVPWAGCTVKGPLSISLSLLLYRCCKCRKTVPPPASTGQSLLPPHCHPPPPHCCGFTKGARFRKRKSWCRFPTRRWCSCSSLPKAKAAASAESSCEKDNFADWQGRTIVILAHCRWHRAVSLLTSSAAAFVSIGGRGKSNQYL